MLDTTIPDVPMGLLVELEKRFPDRAPNLTDTVDAIRFRSGEVNIIRFLRMHHNRQQAPALMKVKP